MSMFALCLGKTKKERLKRQILNQTEMMVVSERKQRRFDFLKVGQNFT